MKSPSPSDGGNPKEDHGRTDAMWPRDLTGKDANPSGATRGEESRWTGGCDPATAASISPASEGSTEEAASKVDGSTGDGAREPVDPEESILISGRDGASDGRSVLIDAESYKMSIVDTKGDGCCSFLTDPDIGEAVHEDPMEESEESITKDRPQGKRAELSGGVPLVEVGAQNDSSTRTGSRISRDNTQEEASTAVGDSTEFLPESATVGKCAQSGASSWQGDDPVDYPYSTQQGTGLPTSGHALPNQNTVTTEGPLDQDMVPTAVLGQRSSPVQPRPGAYRVGPSRQMQHDHSGNSDAADFDEDAAALTAPQLRRAINTPVFEGCLVEEGTGRQGATDESSSAFVVTESIAPTRQRSSRTQLIDRAVEHIRHIARNAPLVEGISITETQNATSVSGWKAMRCGDRILFIILAAVFVVAAAGAAAATTTIIRRRRNTAAAGDLGATPSASTTRFEELRRIVSVLSDGGGLSDPTSPQFAALSWLANQDELLPSPLQNVEVVIQRYVMALFYFSTGGENWSGNNLLEAAAMHCMLYETTCWEELEGIEMERTGPGRPYLSEALHECEWEGVGCYEGTDVVGAISMINNNLTGEIPQEIGALKLQELHLPNNKIGGTFPNSIQDFGGYSKAIILSLNLLTGTIPDIFNTLPNLTYFGCSINPLSGTIPQSLNGHKNLKKFFANFVGLSGTIPLDFDTMPSLENVQLGGNALSGPIPPSIGGWPNADLLFLNMNQITGTIPDSLGGLSGLKALSLGANHLSGTIPSSLFDLKELVLLTLDNNYLTGTIPENLGVPRRMQWLSLENNGLTGTIPESVEDLQDLWMFVAHSNGFTGTIPAAMGDNPALQYLELGNNKFVGTFPDSFKGAFTLEYLGLSKNDLTGNLSFLCDLDITYMYADCGGHTAEIDCDCCLFCCGKEDEIAGCNDYLSTFALGQRYCTNEGLGSIICGGVTR